MPLWILSGKGAVQIMPFRKLGGNAIFSFGFACVSEVRHIHNRFYPLIRFIIMVPCSQEPLLGKFEDMSFLEVKLIIAVEIILQKFNWKN